MGDSTLTTPAEPQPRKSLTERFFGVFFSPGDTFADIARKPDFLLPLILLIVTSVAVTETMLAKIGMERIIRASIEQSGRGSNLSPEQLDRAVQRGAQIGSIIAHISAFLGAPILVLIIAGLGLMIVNSLYGSQASFKAVFSVTCYGSLVRVLGAIMALPMIFFGDPEHFNAQNPIPSNIGFFLDAHDVSKPLLSLATSLDFLTIWSLILLGIGLSEVTGRKVKALTIFLTYFGLWMIWVLGRAGLASLG